MSFEIAAGGANLRVHGIRPDLWQSLASDVRRRQSVIRGCLPPVHVLEIGSGAVLLAESRSSETLEIATPPPLVLDALLADTLRWSRQISTAMTELHASGNVWLNFDPDAVEVCGDRLRITNLDWRLFPIGQCPACLARISHRYSPPEVCHFRDEQIGPQTDVFHLAMGIYYRLAGLYPQGFAGNGLESFRFEVPPLRIFRPDLPFGIWPVLRRGLSSPASARQQTTSELVQQLEEVMECPRRSVSAVSGVAESRSTRSILKRILGFNLKPGAAQSENSSISKVAIEVGWQTTTGRAKQALGEVNQDQAAILSFPFHNRTIQLYIVADGVTHSKVGSGDQASRLACEQLSRSIQQQADSIPGDQEPDWASILISTCEETSESIVHHALSLPDRPAHIRDNDLMSTTILIGLIDGQDLFLANSGDSRAYLLANGLIDQLTVDGDVASTQLANLMPPEQVQELGSAGKALRYCLGAGRETPDGELVCDRNRATPQVGRWRISPGQIYVLCTDGLVEEGVFLDPADLVTIIGSVPHPSAQDLVHKLITAADARQRLPSSSEPNGYGDNITCVVMQVVSIS